MAQVSMTGNEYAEMLRKIEQGAEIIRYLKAERKVKFTEDNIRIYSSGEFPPSHTFPEWLQDTLVRDMVDQLLHMDADEFGLWATTDHHFYDVKGREMNSWVQDRNIDLLEVSPELNERRELIRAEVKTEIDEEVPTDGE
jgi:hypothetical protein